MYYWVAESNDGCYEDRSEEYFVTKREAYDDMRNAVLEKMKWNTEYDEDFSDGTKRIDYHVIFSKNCIVHESYSGIYTYKIMEKVERKESNEEDRRTEFKLRFVDSTDDRTMILRTTEPYTEKGIRNLIDIHSCILTDYGHDDYSPVDILDRICDDKGWQWEDMDYQEMEIDDWR